MKINYFHAGLHLTLNDVGFRIERISESGMCFLERLADHAIVHRPKSELVKLFEKGEIHIEGNQPSQNVNKNRNSIDVAIIPEDQQKDIFRKREYIIGAEKMLGKIPTVINIQIAIDKVAELINDNKKPSGSSVFRWWKIWISSEKNILSLLNKKPAALKNRKFRGTPLKIILEIIEEHYLTEQRTSVQDVYDFLCHRFLEINKTRFPSLKVPSRPTFYRMIKNLDPYECMSARQGKSIADRHFRAVGGGVSTSYILERVEVDHTPLDVMVVNEKTGLPDGRPWLTVLLDRYSRMPLGIEIGFEPPSELAVMNALRNSIRPKTEILKIYPDILNDWPGYGIPTTLVCDNGREFHATNLKRMCAELNIEIQFCPKKQPNYKGAVERFLGTLNRAVCHRLSGTTFSNIQQRNEYDSASSAKTTLAELKSLIHEWIVDIYCHEINRTTGKTPYDLWKEGLEKREPLLPESIQQLNLILAKEMQRKLNHEGVTIFGIAYNSAELGVLRRRSDETFNVKVRVDPSNLESVWVYDDINGDYIVVPSIYPEYTTGLSLLEHREIRKIDRKNNQSEQDVLSLLTKKAKFTEKLKDLSKSKKIRPRQKAERHNLHKQTASNDNKKRSELTKQQALSFTDLNISEIPRFDTTKRGDF